MLDLQFGIRCIPWRQRRIALPDAAHDLSLSCHPAAIRTSADFASGFALVARGDLRTWSGCAADRRETQETVFDARERAFAFFKGVCGRGIHDNMKTAADAIFVGKDRRGMCTLLEETPGGAASQHHGARRVGRLGFALM